MHNFTNNKMPAVFDTFFNKAIDVHSHNTRQKGDFRAPLCKSKLGTNFVKKTGSCIWQTYKSEHKKMTSVRVCKRNMIKIILNEYCLQ